MIDTVPFHPLKRLPLTVKAIADAVYGNCIAARLPITAFLFELLLFADRADVGEPFAFLVLSSIPRSGHASAGAAVTFWPCSGDPLPWPLLPSVQISNTSNNQNCIQNYLNLPNRFLTRQKHMFKCPKAAETLDTQVCRRWITISRLGRSSSSSSRPSRKTACGLQLYQSSAAPLMSVLGGLSRRISRFRQCLLD